MADEPLEGNFVQENIITTKITFINIDEDISNPNEYRDAFHKLRTASDNDVIRLIINSHGGILDTAIQFYDCLKNTKAKTEAEIHVAYSAGAMIALSCDDIIVNEFSSMMIHCLSWVSSGKVPEIIAKSDFIEDWNKIIKNRVYKGFLTDIEIEKINEGIDLWFLAPEIEKRLKKRVKIR